MSNSANNTLPQLTSVSDLFRVMQKWRTQLNPLLKNLKTPHAPANFTATSQRGGILLAWAPMASQDADGYQILSSPNGDFANPQVIQINDVRQSNYFDSLGGTSGSTTPITRWYRIRATNGTPTNSQSILGILSGAVTNSSIDPTNTVAPSVTVTDNATTDQLNVSAGRGRILPQRFTVD